MKAFYPVKTLNQLRPLLIGLRKTKGLVQQVASERLGVTHQIYARLEAYTVRAGTKRLFKVLILQGVEINLSFEASSSEMDSTEKKSSVSDSPVRLENSDFINSSQQRLSIWMNGIRKAQSRRFAALSP